MITLGSSLNWSLPWPQKDIPQGVYSWILKWPKICIPLAGKRVKFNHKLANIFRRQKSKLQFAMTGAVPQCFNKNIFIHKEHVFSEDTTEITTWFYKTKDKPWGPWPVKTNWSPQHLSSRSTFVVLYINIHKIYGQPPKTQSNAPPKMGNRWFTGKPNGDYDLNCFCALSISGATLPSGQRKLCPGFKSAL